MSKTRLQITVLRKSRIQPIKQVMTASLQLSNSEGICVFSIFSSLRLFKNFKLASNTSIRRLLQEFQHQEPLHPYGQWRQADPQLCNRRNFGTDTRTASPAFQNSQYRSIILNLTVYSCQEPPRAKFPFIPCNHTHQTLASALSALPAQFHWSHEAAGLPSGCPSGHTNTADLTILYV